MFPAQTRGLRRIMTLRILLAFIGLTLLATATPGRAIKDRGSKAPGFYFFRFVWVNPRNIIDTLAALNRKRHDLSVEVLDPHTFFALFKEFQERRDQPTRR